MATRTNSCGQPSDPMKQAVAVRRLRAMHTPFRPIAFAAVKSLAMVVLAMLLILVLLPAALSAQAATI